MHVYKFQSSIFTDIVYLLFVDFEIVNVKCVRKFYIGIAITTDRPKILFRYRLKI